MKELIISNFKDYIDNFFEDGDNEKEVLEKLCKDGSQNIALISSVVLSYIGRVTDENKEATEKELTDLIYNIIKLSTTYGVVKFLDDLANEGGVAQDEQGTVKE